MIDLCDPDHIKLAIIAAATLGCMFGCLVTQFLCNRDWRRLFLSRLLVERELARQQFLDQRLVHHPLKKMVDKDLDHCRAEVIELQAVVEQG